MVAPCILTGEVRVMQKRIKLRDGGGKTHLKTPPIQDACWKQFYNTCQTKILI